MDVAIGAVSLVGALVDVTSESEACDKRFSKEVDNPDLGTGFTVRAAWFPT